MTEAQARARYTVANGQFITGTGSGTDLHCEEDEIINNSIIASVKETSRERDDSLKKQELSL
jgi:hypothetical protein